MVLKDVSDAFHPGSLSNYMEQNPLLICTDHLAWVENEPLFFCASEIWELNLFCGLTPPLLVESLISILRATSYCMPTVCLSTLLAFSLLILTVALWDSCYYFPFPDEEAEIQSLVHCHTANQFQNPDSTSGLSDFKLAFSCKVSREVRHENIFCEKVWSGRQG